LPSLTLFARLKECLYRSGWAPGLYCMREIWWTRLSFPNHKAMPAQRPIFMKDCWLVSAFALYRLMDAQSELEHMRPKRIIVQPFSWRWYSQSARRCKLYYVKRNDWTDFSGRVSGPVPG
jgi:hypothetical protein